MSKNFLLRKDLKDIHKSFFTHGFLNFIAAETDGTGYRTSKFELDAENTAAQIEYDAPAEIVIKHSGETRPPRYYVVLADQAKKFADAAQILNYFLDGSLQRQGQRPARAPQARRRQFRRADLQVVGLERLAV